MVENASAPYTLMTYQKRSGTPTGICWWGSVNPDDGTSMPVTDEKEIHSVMDIFGISLYKGEETERALSIPYMIKHRLNRMPDTYF